MRVEKKGGLLMSPHVATNFLIMKGFGLTRLTINQGEHAIV